MRSLVIFQFYVPSEGLAARDVGKSFCFTVLVNAETAAEGAPSSRRDVGILLAVTDCPYHEKWTLLKRRTNRSCERLSVRGPAGIASRVRRHWKANACWLWLTHARPTSSHERLQNGGRDSTVMTRIDHLGATCSSNKFSIAMPANDLAIDTYEALSLRHDYYPPLAAVPYSQDVLLDDIMLWAYSRLRNAFRANDAPAKRFTASFCAVGTHLSAAISAIHPGVELLHARGVESPQSIDVLLSLEAPRLLHEALTRGFVQYSRDEVGIFAAKGSASYAILRVRLDDEPSASGLEILRRYSRYFDRCVAWQRRQLGQILTASY